MKIAIFGNTYREALIPRLIELLDFLSTKVVDVLFERDLFDFLIANKLYAINNDQIIDTENFQCDFAMSVGGDGTFLKTAASVGNRDIPILGINIGRLGFLADISGENMLMAVEGILKKDYILEERTLLTVIANDGTPLEMPYALNEISILKQDSSSMISIHTTLNGEPMHTYQADGLLVATPTGSTAYSMSVGGPLLVPQAANFLLSPVASHSLNVRPLVIPDTWVVDLEVKSRSGCYQISLDGRTTILPESTKLHIQKANFTIKVVKQMHHSFFDNLKNKLMWGLDKRN
ncbi:MAG: NAD kinase [Porphyromonadaceae bacterium CG2_30_38_12]|nr:MAG: NAD kinase [Porphyromonadaceae bacterium CG2_30_38_12]